MLLKASELQNKKILIFGLNGTGKTYLAKHLSRYFKTFVITMNSYEWKNENVVVGECKLIEDYKFWCDFVVSNYNKLKVNLVILDDFDVFFEHHLETLPSFQNLVYRNRHMGLSVIAITRRPQNLPAKYWEAFDILVGFTVHSPTTVQKLNQIYPSLGDMVAKLQIGSYKFVWYDGKNPPKVMKV